MGRKSSVWQEIARDRERRQKAAEGAQRVHRQVANELMVDARRQQVAQDRAEKERRKQALEEQRLRNLAEADEQTERLGLRVRELVDLLAECLRCHPVTVEDVVRPEVPEFDPGDDAVAEPALRRPVQGDGGLFGRGRRRREFQEAMARYETEKSRYRRRELDRQARLARRRDEHDQRVRELGEQASRHAEQLKRALGSGEEQAVEEFAAAALSSLPIPDGIDLAPRIAYRREPRELVVDIQLPDVGVVPSEESITYIHARDRLKIKERPRADVARIYLRILAQLPLAVVHTLFGTIGPDVLNGVTVNGLRATVDPATGRPKVLYQVSVTTSRETFDGLVLQAHELDPVQCLGYLGAKLAKHPLDFDEVKPFLAFDHAKYRLADSVDVVAGLDSRTNLCEIEWGDFEQLVRQLLHAMNGGEARVTRRSRDDGIDGVLFDCNVVMGGEYIVQAKRYRYVVPANDVRALAGVMHDKRANHAIFVTPSWFSDDGRRFAADNRIRLIEGPELKQLLHQYLDLEVVIPLAGKHRERSTRP